VVRGFEDLPDESVDGLLDYAASPADDVALVLVHGGGPKGSGVLTRLRKAASVTEVKSAALTAREHPGFVADELRRHKVKIDADAAAFLVQAVGQDLRALAAAASQLAGDFEGKPVTIDMVKTYFGGRAEAKSFAVADHAIFGRAAKALEELRWALDGGTPPVLVTSAVAGSLRGLAKFKSAPKGMRNADLMRDVGVPGWKLDILRDQARGWDDGGIARAIRVVAAADAEIKGKAHDASYALEKMVLDVVRARPRRAS
jgi:DNA polymerase-3 subunit delta